MLPAPLGEFPIRFTSPSTAVYEKRLALAKYALPLSQGNTHFGFEVDVVDVVVVVDVLEVVVTREEVVGAPVVGK